MSSKYSFPRQKICFCKTANLKYRSIISCTFATMAADLFAIHKQPIFFFSKSKPKQWTCDIIETVRKNLSPHDFLFIPFKVRAVREIRHFNCC